ncbi:NapD-like protein [Formosa agariphila KMM 3901]|uniref:phosphoserine phosphatase n=1 Tax=Formosa agariphila (strain DSM 15362 / KCTC 12365 / LMG 23005 / KMM 3901 / M-2Alg 35-1) TaxID=1347342 RepID=T2KHW3_FORAG|nr:HAD family hydrolase [Formosa agariphila]CDF78385.1 NapD-like protein [Formosa agariphila KMM 3901]
MKTNINTLFVLCFFVFFIKVSPVFAQSASNTSTSEILKSWNNTANKQAIIAYVSDVTNPKSSNFIPVADRIATFDNDGTLWSEQPAYFQFFFAIDRVKKMAKDHPEWKTEQPFKAVLENDMEALKASGMEGLIKLVMTTHAGMTSTDFEKMVKEWSKTAVHPTKKVPFTDMIFQPMLELLTYLRANEFKTYIVSGGGIEFMRAFLTDVYGIPTEQIIGSTVKTKFEIVDGVPVINRLAELDHNDDKGGKPESINKYIGKKPVFAAGNSDGDLAMLQYTDSNTYKSFQLYIHHTDAAREWAYDRTSSIGKFDKGLDEAIAKKWTVVSMKTDWSAIYPR